MSDDALNLPQYEKPKGIPVCHFKQQAPLFKMAKMIAKFRSPKLKTSKTNRAIKKRKRSKVI